MLCAGAAVNLKIFCALFSLLPLKSLLFAWLNFTVCIVLLNFAQCNIAGYFLEGISNKGKSWAVGNSGV